MFKNHCTVINISKNRGVKFLVKPMKVFLFCNDLYISEFLFIVVTCSFCIFFRVVGSYIIHRLNLGFMHFLLIQ